MRRTDAPMAIMTDVFVELERLKCSLEELREKLVHDDRVLHEELYDARRSCRIIERELNVMKSLLRSPGDELSEPPKGPPDFKLVS